MLTIGHHSKIFSLNLCEDCIIRATHPIRRLRRNSEVIWTTNVEVPYVYFSDLVESSLSDLRDIKLFQRAIEAKYHVMLAAKKRRNHDRKFRIGDKASDFKITIGVHKSWGILDKFDEYFGTLNNEGLPHGKGVMFYSDGSIYAGGWQDGMR